MEIVGIKPDGKAGKFIKNLYQKRERPEERYFAALSKGLDCNSGKYSNN